MKARIAVAALAVSAGGVGLIATHEGNILRGYLDPVGIVTACRGHTASAQLGRIYTEKECDALFRADIIVAERAVKRAVTIPLAQPTYDAIVSFTFNVGEGNLRRSTLLRKLNAGDIVGACNELPRWNKAGGRVLPGLVKRRAEERALCLEGA
jgi:lysozyme